MTTWRYYFPDDGETADDARECPAEDCVTDADDAADSACRLDYDRHDGAERKGSEFVIAVLSPDGDETRYRAWHEPTVSHHTREIA